jgi:hypothetical protein
MSQDLVSGLVENSMSSLPPSVKLTTHGLVAAMIRRNVEHQFDIALKGFSAEFAREPHCAECYRH